MLFGSLNENVEVAPASVKSFSKFYVEQTPMNYYFFGGQGFATLKTCNKPKKPVLNLEFAVAIGF